jgi:trigger factor
VKVTVEQLPRRQVVLNIEAEQPEVDHAKEHAYHHVSQRVRIPGFRKGKVPKAMLDRYVGQAAIMEEAVNHLIPEVTQKAIQEQSLEAIGVPQVALEGVEPNIKWKATVDLTPKVDLAAYKDIRLTPESAEVTEEQITKVLEDIRFQNTPWEPADRPAQMGDLATIDMSAESEGKPLGSDKAAQYRLMEGSISPVPGFAEQLAGMKGGETKEFSIAVPESDTRKSLAGKTVSFKVTVIDVKGKMVPAFDDEFAKGVGEGYDSMQALRDYVTKQLKENAEREAKEKLKEKALDEVVAKAAFEFSPNLTQREAEEMFKEQTERLQRSKIGLDEYLKSIGKSQEAIIEELKPMAEERIKRSLALAELIKQEKIDVIEDEIDSEMNGLIASGGEQNMKQFERIFDTENGRRSIQRTLQQRKVLDRLIEIVTQPAAA